MFKDFPTAWYATNVNFPQSFRPQGTHEEAKKYFSVEHKLYCLKAEVSVYSLVLAICCSPHGPGSVSTIGILYNGVHTNDLLRKKNRERNIEYDRPYRS